MKKVHLFLLFALFATGLSAQTQGKNTTILPLPVDFAAEATMTTNPVFQLAPNTELRRVSTHVATSGHEHVKYHQYLEGLQVLGGTVVFHLEDGQLYATTGRLAKAGQTAKDFRLNSSQAERLALLRLSQELHLSKGIQVQKTIRAFANAGYPRAGGATVAVFVVRLKADAGPERLPVDTEVIVSAASGRVLASLSNIHTETVTGHGDGFYHQDITFPVDSLAADEFELHDASRGEGIYAFDISNDYRTPSDADNEWTPELEGHQAMIDGYYASVKFYDFLQDRFGRNSIDDEGFPLVANMNQHNYVNAYWNGSETTYGNGNCDDYSPLTTFTVVGHEYAHGLTEFTSGLIYQDESGALNESISDIFGKALQFYYDNEHFNWRIGSDIRRRSDVRYFRDMANPTQRNHPKFYKGENWRTGQRDAGGVHSNSGVFNFWFYLLVEGKSAVAEEGTFYDVERIGMDSALQLVYLLETAYLTESSAYSDCHDFSLLAAAELFGIDSEPYNSVVEAWKAVGLPVEPVTGGGTELAVLSNVTNNSGSFDYRFCPEELESFSYWIEDLPELDVIPYGSRLNGTISFSYFSDNGEVTDTVFFNDLATSSDNYTQSGRLELGLSHELVDGGDFLQLAGDFNITSPDNQVYMFTTGDFILINDLTEISMGFSFNEFSSTCGEPEIEYGSYSIELPRCVENLEGFIKVVFTNGSEEVIYEEALSSNDDTYVYIDVPSDVDISSLGSPNGVSFSIFYLVGGEETLIVEDNYSQYFANLIGEETVYPFEDPTSSQVDLAIGLCAACPQDFTGEKLNIRDSSFIFDIEDCIPTDEYMNDLLQPFSILPTNIKLCVDAGTIDEPHLVFTLNQPDDPEYSDTENQFLHMVDVYDDDGSILDAPITGTNGTDLGVEIPLPEDFEGTLTIYVVSTGVTTTIDDLGVTAGKPSPVRHLGLGDFGFSYVNPVTNRLAVWAGKTVPAGTNATLFRTTGQTVGTSMMQGQQLEMDMNDLPAGLYFLTISDGRTFSWTGKVIRQ